MNLIALPDEPVSFPTQAASFALHGPAGKLETISDVAEPAVARCGVAVICHPNPVQGGTMHNKVVTICERALRESGLDTVRFNFRGTGNSTGHYDEGHGEGDDLAAIVAWIRRMRPNDALWLAGFSFGSYVSLCQAASLRADALISVAPPVDQRDVSQLSLPSCPWLIVQGEADEVVDPQAVFDWVETIQQSSPKRTLSLIRMPETGHFFHRRLIDLRGAIKHSVRLWLPPARA